MRIEGGGRGLTEQEYRTRDKRKEEKVDGKTTMEQRLI
jgi:hypothetical protein